jgi:hypothetical protein
LELDFARIVKLQTCYFGEYSSKLHAVPLKSKQNRKYSM